MIVVLTVLVTLFSLWWVIAYLYAYLKLRETLLLIQIGQGLALTLMFAYLTVALLNQLSINPVFVGLLILLSLAASLVWRVRGGIKILVQRYPRGMLDVLTFRKPAVDFKRRVRGK